jgi:uncharacterized protein (DUF1499 family)
MLRRALAVVVLLLAGAAAGLAAHLALSGEHTVFSWKRPEHLGVREGRLAPCPRSPNCVSSQADPADRQHYVAPIEYRDAAPDAMAAVRKAVESMQRVTVLRHEPEYLYAEFRSRRMRFVDDVEFFYDRKAGLVHVRSASRLGRRDFGVNRERIEAIRALLAAGRRA